MVVIRAALCAVAFCAATVLAAASDDIVLSSRDGSVELSGRFLGFDGEFYRIDTVFGPLTVDSSGVSCTGAACPSLTDFVAELQFSGAGSVGAVLVPALIEGFAKREGLEPLREAVDDRHITYRLRDRASGRTVGRFSIHLATTAEGFADLLAQETDIVMARREARPDEIALIDAAGLGNLQARGRVRVLALDGLVAVVSADNPLGVIRLADLLGILAGDISNWAALGGEDAPIALHLPAAGSGLAEAIEDQILRRAQLALTPRARRHEDERAIAARVAADPFAIGVTAMTIAGTARPLPLGGECDIVLPPGRRAVKTEDYPLTAPVFLYVPARRLPRLARDFLTYLDTGPAQQVVRRAGFVDQTPETIPIDHQGGRFANAIRFAGPDTPLEELQRMVVTLAPWQRLTTTFRFETGSTRLDAQSRANVDQLARAIEAGSYDRKRLLLVGFSDGIGPASGNRSIALRRAETVRRAIEEAATATDPDRLEIATDAFGEAMPMACDDSAWGRQVNRRVEVWVQ